MAHQFAYLDAGSASMALQVIAGAVAAAAVTVKLFWRRILVGLHLRRPTPDGLADDATIPDQRQDRPAPRP